MVTSLIAGMALLAALAQSAAPPASLSPRILTAPKLVTVPVTSYPVDALLRHEEGRTTVRIEIDGKGRVARCAVVTSSGSAALDKATCLGMKQWQYSPALDADGKGVPTALQRSVLWRLPKPPVEPIAPAAASTGDPH